MNQLPPRIIRPTGVLLAQLRAKADLYELRAKIPGFPLSPSNGLKEILLNTLLETGSLSWPRNSMEPVVYQAYKLIEAYCTGQRNDKLPSPKFIGYQIKLSADGSCELAFGRLNRQKEFRILDPISVAEFTHSPSQQIAAAILTDFFRKTNDPALVREFSRQVISQLQGESVLLVSQIDKFIQDHQLKGAYVS